MHFLYFRRVIDVHYLPKGGSPLGVNNLGQDGQDKKQ